MTTEQYNEMKKGYFEMVTQMMVEAGELGPSITVLGTHKEDGKSSIIHIPIIGKFMKSEESKDKFVDVVLPEIAQKVRKEFDVDAVIWASEAWLRVTDAKDKTREEALVDWKNLPIKKEVLIMSIESEDKTEFEVKEIVRKGKQVNEKGELIDQVELVYIDEFDGDGGIVEGRFTGLYKKFKGSPAES